ncbi:MAG: sulfate permease [bacterium]|nr:sulfate permease [Gammaproteobacteria bacterium]HIL98387.1 sulfate permease [Pseudomonadales bacterium]
MLFLRRIFPIIDWMSGYGRSELTADTIGGLVVLFITIPQVIAYAFLAGMPAETGLYAAILALVCYALFGSSRTLAVGPTAIVAMMTLEATSRYASPGTEVYVETAMKLGLVTGLILLLLRIVNFGAVISFLSHAVVSGFITAAAILIMTNQLPAILGLVKPPGTDVVSVVSHVLTDFGSLNVVSLSIGLATVVLLWFCRNTLEKWLQDRGYSELMVSALTKSAPMYAVILSVAVVYFGSLHIDYGVSIVGDIPKSLPQLRFNGLSLGEIQNLAPSALLIAMVVFMESTSIGAAVASKRREKIQPNQELVGLGFANVGASLVGGFPVAGSFARTVVNYSSGAVTQIASLITAALVLVTLVWLTPFFVYLPKSVLSAIIIMSAMQLIDLHGIRRTFSFNRTDAVTFSFTFFAVLGLGVESGILIGIAISFVLLIRNSSQPHIAVVGRWQGTEHFRNILRHDVETFPHVLSVRIDESLYFVNTQYIETFLLNKVAESPELEHILLICTATNFIDTSGLEMLELLSDNLEEVGVTLHLAEVKGPVMDKLKETDFYKRMKGEIFFTTDLALKALAPTGD